MTWTLYRCYDAPGRLLYVGLTSNLKRRMSMHMNTRKHQAGMLLQKHMARVEADADTYLTEDEGRDAERRAIIAEQPLFNYAWRRVPGWLIKADIARYEAGEPTRDWFDYLKSNLGWSDESIAAGRLPWDDADAAWAIDDFLGKQVSA